MAGMMDPEIKRQWVEALRSGEYKQGQAQLRYGDKFCCMGVLCDLAVKAGVVDEFVSDEGAHYYGRDHAFGVLPDEVKDWAMTGTIHPFVNLPGPQGQLGRSVSLGNVNDMLGLPFERISYLIDSSL